MLLPITLCLSLAWQAPVEGVLFDRPVPTVVPSSGSLDDLDVSTRGIRLPDGGGFEWTVTVANDRDTPVTLKRVTLSGELRGCPAAPVALRVDGPGSTAIFQFSDAIEAEFGIVVADRRGRSAVAAGLPESSGRIRMTPSPDDPEVVLLEADLGTGTITPGDTWRSAPVRCVRVDGAFDAVVGLFGVDGDHPDADPMTSAPAIVFGDDGRPRAHPRGQPLDLIPGGPRCDEWLIDRGRLLLINESAETRVHVVDADDLRHIGDAIELTDEQGRSFGRFDDRMFVPVAPRRALLLSASPVASDPADPSSGYDVVLVTPFEDKELPAAVERIDVDSEDARARIVTALDRGGAVFANHRGTTHLHPLPPAIDDLLIARVFPYRPADARLPRTPAEERFAARASSVSWALDFPTQPVKTSEAWFASREAGFYAAPLQPVLVDGLHGGRGFAIYTNPGVVVVTMDLDERQVDAMASLLIPRDARLDVLRATSAAALAVRRSGEAGGLFDDMPYDRVGPGDLVPADPHVGARWTVALPADRSIAIRTLPAAGGDLVTEEVLQFSKPLLFVLQIPQPLEGDVVFLVRRAATPSPTLYNIHIDMDPIGPPMEARRDDDRGGWRDELLVLKPEHVGGRERVAMSLAPEGGRIAVARVGVFLDERKEGEHLTSIQPTAVDVPAADEAARRFPGFDRSATGDGLRLDGRVHLSGLGLRPGHRVEYRLPPGARSLLGRVGIDAATGSGRGSAILRVLVDGEERYRSPTLVGAAPSRPVTVDVRGGTTVAIVVEDAGDGRDGDLVSFVDARLIRES